MTRTDSLTALRAQASVPVLIVGGGINGAGLFRELCLQGVGALLVDRADFCSGASASSSRMIHGGLRYLENGEFRLVRESLKERDLLLRNAPHYVRPLPTTIPIYSWFSGVLTAIRLFLTADAKPQDRGALVIKAGLTMYDLYSRQRRAVPVHTFSGRAAALRAHPGLNPAIVCAATYYDAWVSYPERLCLELIQDGEQVNPRAHALNYMGLINAAGETVTLRDELTGETIDVHPQIVVNAGGAWIDAINGALHKPSHFIGGTKGSHLLIDSPELHAALNGQMILYENADHRVCLMFPLHNKVLIGSTDLRVDDPDTARTTDADIDYMLASARDVFPTIALDRAQIVSHYVGVRPLPSSESDSTGKISRDHSIQLLPPDDRSRFPVMSLVGGKWTTFRALAEQVTDQLLPLLGARRTKSSDSVAIGGGKDYPIDPDAWVAEQARTFDLTVERMQQLLDRYGTRAIQVARYLTAAADLPLIHHRAYSRREIGYLICEERVCRLSDLILRRTTLALAGDLTPPLLDELGALAASLLHWDAARLQQEIELTNAVLDRQYGIHLSAAPVQQEA